MLHFLLSCDKWENVRSHVIGCHARCLRGRHMAATVEEVCFEVKSVLFSWKDHWMVIFNTSTAHSSVNQYSKSWFCEILRDMFRDGCQCLRTSVDYLIFVITLQICKFLDVTSASPTPLRKKFPTVATIVVSSTETTCVTTHPVCNNNFPFISRYFDFIARYFILLEHFWNAKKIKLSS